MTYNLANMTPSERVRMPGNWQELDDVQDLSAITRIWWRSFEVDEVEPGSFRRESTIPTGPLGNGWVVLEGVTYTRSDLVDGEGRKVTVHRELDDIVAVEVSA
jgi:hypothetical protein